MHSPVAPDELAAAIRAEVAAGAAWVKIIGDFPEWAEGGPVPRSAAATYDLDTLRRRLDQRARAQDRGRRDGLPYAVAHGVRILAGTDVVGTIANEIALLAEHGLTARQAIAAAGSAARDFLGVHPEGDIVTYDDDPLKDPGVLAHPAAVVVRGKRVRLRLRKRHDG
jgi:imidazolonepropionase-like amidohydrolase